MEVKFYNSFGPNPRALRVFLAEKGVDLPTVHLDILGAENRRPPYTDVNPGGQIPALVLDDGTVIGETVAIFEYLEEAHPEPALIGASASDRAEARQWQRRIELRITENLYNGFRFAEGLDMFKDRMTCAPEAASGLKKISAENVKWLDRLIEGREWIVPDRFTIADIILFCALDFGAGLGQPIDDGCRNVRGWFDRVASRPSAESSLHPSAGQVGMRG